MATVEVDGQTFEADTLQDAVKAARKAERAATRRRKATEADTPLAYLCCDAEIGKMARIAPNRPTWVMVDTNRHYLKGADGYYRVRLDNFKPGADPMYVSFTGRPVAVAEHADGRIWAVQLEADDGYTQWEVVAAYGLAARCLILTHGEPVTTHLDAALAEANAREARRQKND